MSRYHHPQPIALEQTGELVLALVTRAVALAAYGAGAAAHVAMARMPSPGRRPEAPPPGGCIVRHHYCCHCVPSLGHQCCCCCC